MAERKANATHLAAATDRLRPHRAKETRPQIVAPTKVDASSSVSRTEIYPKGQFLSPLTRRIQSTLRGLSEKDFKLHDDRFIKVGGSGSSTPMLLSCLDKGPIELGDWQQLKPTLRRFRSKLSDGSSAFSRKSLAAKPGATAQWVLSGEPAPLEQEIEAVQPRFALVHYGTNDMHQKGTYESAIKAFTQDMARLLKRLEDRGIVPIVTSVTPRDDHPKADGWIPLFNHSLRALAQYHAVPYLNIHSAILSLPNRGRAEDKLHGNVYRENGIARPCFFDEESLRFTYNVRNLLTARMLDKLFRLVRGESVPLDEADTLQGNGSGQQPWTIPNLPFAHRIDTSRATQFDRSAYSGCSNFKDVSGPEYEYKLSVATTQRIRAFVLADTNVDVDLFLLEDNGDSGTCLSHGGRSLTRSLIAGSSYRFVVDTRTDNGSPKWGEATLIIHRCGVDDPICS